MEQELEETGLLLPREPNIESAKRFLKMTHMMQVFIIK
jgi:hypothetical protein